MDTLTSVPTLASIKVGNNGTSGGYKFDPGQVQSVIGKWQALLDDLHQDVDNARKVAEVRAPGKEFASSDFVDKGADPSQTLLVQHQRMVTYVENYIAALKKASGKIQQNEDDAQQMAARQGQGVV